MSILYFSKPEYTDNINNMEKVPMTIPKIEIEVIILTELLLFLDIKYLFAIYTGTFILLNI
ncbi:hypothetical protein JBKA6_1049 [Ichthyobacterium seriolicida]|uniref:Uncharacterized protein n=1 Tax=Ichthyobacterium seriolicida TaxID=242600 RepID=A0A1J1E6U5_9FLAO|nr:hypothetical protein JBKA6_1049 [Ichthyobacterium seriolicida]